MALKSSQNAICDDSYVHRVDAICAEGECAKCEHCSGDAGTKVACGTASTRRLLVRNLSFNGQGNDLD